LTAPEYRSSGSLSETIHDYVDELAAFEGTDEPWGRDNIQISKSDIANRVLLIIIPLNSPPEVYEELLSCIEYANLHGVQIIVEKYGNSDRYLVEENSSKSSAEDNPVNNVP